MKRVIALMCFSALVMAGGTGCGTIQLFTSTHTHYDVNKDAQKRLDSLEGRVGQLEGCPAQSPVTICPEDSAS